MTETGTRYEVKSGSKPSASWSPVDKFTVNSGTVYGANGDGTVGCSATISPVTISLSGTTPDSNGDGGLNILVGQHCGASLSGIPSACSVTYQWSVSGTTFQTWSADTPAIGNNPYNPDASYEVDGPGPLTNSTASWYWNDLHQTSETVSCTATVTPPSGQGSQFTVTASKQVEVYVPTLTATGYGSAVYVDLGNGTGDTSDYFLLAGQTAVSEPGMEFGGSVTSPASTVFGNGSLVLVQLAVPDRSYESDDGECDWSENGQEGLDTQYPYGWATSNQQATPPTPQYTTSDSPGIDLINQFDLDAEGALSAHLGDQFEDYFMYFAPGSSQCVPVGHFVWSTSADATRPDSGGWAAFGSGTAGTVTPSGSRMVPLSNAFPMWTQINSATAGYFSLSFN